MSWDWKDQPDLDELDRHVSNMTAVRHHGRMVRIHSVDTDSDEYGIVITDEELTPEEIGERWRAWWQEER